MRKRPHFPYIFLTLAIEFAASAALFVLARGPDCGRALGRSCDVCLHQRTHDRHVYLPAAYIALGIFALTLVLYGYLLLRVRSIAKGAKQKRSEKKK